MEREKKAWRESSAEVEARDQGGREEQKEEKILENGGVHSIHGDMTSELPKRELRASAKLKNGGASALTKSPGEACYLKEERRFPTMQFWQERSVRFSTRKRGDTWGGMKKDHEKIQMRELFERKKELLAEKKKGRGLHVYKGKKCDRVRGKGKGSGSRKSASAKPPKREKEKKTGFSLKKVTDGAFPVEWFLKR